MSAKVARQASSGQCPAGVELRGVKKTFGAVNVLHDIDLTVGAGEFVVFVGPSGCGKSTLLRLIAGLEDVTDGEIRIGGHDLTDADPSVRGIAMVFQSYALFPHMTVQENMSFGLRMAHRPKEEVAARVESAAEILQLAPLLDRRPSQLSGGQRQRVAIGRAIVRDPRVFLFDEPLSNLDAELRVEMRIEIAKLHRRLGNTMIYVTHDQTEAMTLADKIVVLRAGRIEQVGKPATIYGDPDNVFVAGFIGSPKMNFLEGRISAGRIETIGGTLPLPALANPPADGANVSVGLRPEHLNVAEDGWLTFELDFAEYLGGATWLYGRAGPDASLTVEARGSALPEPGARLRIGFDPSDIYVFDERGLRLR